MIYRFTLQSLQGSLSNLYEASFTQSDSKNEIMNRLKSSIQALKLHDFKRESTAIACNMQKQDQKTLCGQIKICSCADLEGGGDSGLPPPPPPPPPEKIQKYRVP